MTTTDLAPELVVVAHADARLRMNGARVRSSADGAAELEKALAETGARLRPLFGPSEEHILAARRASAWALPDLSVFYHAAVDGDHQAVAARLAEVPAVAGAYVKPPPAIDAAPRAAATLAPAAVTLDLSPHQGHLQDAPGGVGAAGAPPRGGSRRRGRPRPGRGATGVATAGFLPLEWWPDDFAAIGYATANGVIVIEPAGNGAVSLDDPFYNTPAPGFPADWRNPFN